MTATELRVNDINVRLTNIENQVPSFLKKAKPMSGYNPYNLGGGITAQVWMYDFTPIDDNDARFYYVQFNNISGYPGNFTDWIPLPRTFSHFVYTLHPEYVVLNTPTQAIPTIYSATGASYRLIVADTEDYVRIHYNAGPVPISGDYLGFLLIANGPASSMNDMDIENMKPEELIKLTKELAFRVKQMDKSQQKIDKEKIMKETLEHMKRMAEFELVQPPQPKTKK
jgi:hypothetical protein